jgi:hypothetical protein
MFKKAPKFLWIIMLALATVTFSCNKHDDDDDDGGNGGGGGIWNPTIIDGRLPGLFSVSQDQQVQFSQGNLQYRASTNTWRFAENQWDIIGETNSNISQSYNDWIDLFGWGTSGWNNGNVYYQPYDYEYLTDLNNGHGYGPTNGTNHYFNLTNEFANSDWGINNPIINGGNTSHYWRTLTNAEWIYVFNTRTTTSGIRYAKAQVNGTDGVILVPDDWIVSTFSLNKTNKTDANYNSNIINDLVWRNTFEPAGAVFLPAAGNRNGTSVYHIGGTGYYWSSSVDSSHGAHMVNFANNNLYPGDAGSRYFGLSVRLVHSTQNNNDNHIEVTTNNVTDITQTTAVCGGNVTITGNGTVTARGVCWSTNSNPTVNDNHTSNGTGTGNFTSNITGLTPNTTYYVRAYATNNAGTVYGAQKTFSTTALSTAPSIVTNNVTNITQDAAICGGNVTSDGGSPVTARGVCWSAIPNPTINDNHTYNGTGTGNFTSSITGLTQNTTYYVRAFATNSIGTNYGEQKSFTTTDYAAAYVGNYIGQITFTFTSMNNTPVSNTSFPINEFHIKITKTEQLNTVTAIVTINNESHQTYGAATEEKLDFIPFNLVLDKPEQQCLFHLDLNMDGYKTSNEVLNITGNFSGNGSATIIGQEQVFDEVSGSASGILMKQ